MCSLLTPTDELSSAFSLKVKRNDGYPGEAENWFYIKLYLIHTEIFAPKINEINFIPVRDCWLLIGRTVFVTSEKYRPTNQRPRTALCH